MNKPPVVRPENWAHIREAGGTNRRLLLFFSTERAPGFQRNISFMGLAAASLLVWVGSPKMFSTVRSKEK
jgi:hypothetical protein